MNIVNWQIAKGRHRSDLVQLHPSMFMEHGHLIERNDLWVKYDRDYVAYKLYKTLKAVASAKPEDWQESLASASQMYMTETGSE